MLKIKDNVDLKELEKYGIKPIYQMTNSETGKTEIVAYKSDKYCCRWGNILFNIGRNPYHKILNIRNKYIDNYIKPKEFKLEDDNFIDTDLLYDLIKADLVEKVEK